MNTYKIQLKLHTLATCATEEAGSLDSFAFEGIRFSHWYFTWAEGHRKDAWLISYEGEAKNFEAADKMFTKKLHDILPKIAFISQCYTEYIGESLLIHRTDSDIAYFRYRRDSKGVPLYFDNESLEAFTQLNNAHNISNEFFYYWNDMINATGYSSKLLLIFSALEALVKSSLNDKKKSDFLAEVLGVGLRDKIFAQKSGIRHRLVHGEYFSSETDQENYLKQIYEKVIEYFNSNIFKKELIRRVVNPQRSPYGNKEGWSGWLKRTDSANTQFDLKVLVNEWDEKGIGSFDKFNIIQRSEIASDY